MSVLNIEQRMELLPGVSGRRIVREMRWSLHGELVATDIARARVRRWATAGCPEANPEDALCVGDLVIAELVTTALERIPPPVVHHVVGRCLIIAAGRTNDGWTGGATTTLEEPKILVAIAGVGADAEVLTLIAHELSHAWLHASDELFPPDADLARKTTEEKLARAAGEVAGQQRADYFLQQRRQQHDHDKDRREFEACTLTRAWGFTGNAAHYRRSNR